MAYFLGGYDINNNRISPFNTINNIANRFPYNRQAIIRPNNLRDEMEVSHYLLYLLRRRPSPQGRLMGSCQEPTWGDIDTINRLSSSINNPGLYILSALGTISNAPKHLQYVRNAAIHIDKESINLLNNQVVPYYAISKLKYPTDIVYSIERSSGKYALVSLIDEITVFIQLI
jgi:hypothetical protein